MYYIKRMREREIKMLMSFRTYNSAFEFISIRVYSKSDKTTEEILSTKSGRICVLINYIIEIKYCSLSWNGFFSIIKKSILTFNQEIWLIVETSLISLLN